MPDEDEIVLHKVKPDPRAFAVIGTRACTAEQLGWMAKMLDSEWKADEDGVLHTGAAPGIDQAAADNWMERGGRVVLHLPWSGFEGAWWNKYMAPAKGRDRIYAGVTELTSLQKTLVMAHHPRWQQLSQGGRKLQFRNYSIIRIASPVYATPGTRYGGGGTAMGIKLGLHLKSDVIVFDPTGRDWSSCGC